MTFSFSTKAQDLSVQSLQTIIDKLITEGYQVSYTKDLIQSCTLNVIDNSISSQKALEKAVEQCNLALKLVNNVYIIHQKEAQDLQTYIGIIKGKTNQEPLPLAFLKIGDAYVTSDDLGRFSFKTIANQLRFQINYIGYHPLDTIINLGNDLQLSLRPKLFGLEEVIVKAEDEKEVQSVSLDVANLKLNHEVAYFLPGNNNNTIFNMLRLQPGILAAGEQSKDYMIWGSYKGHTQVLFDDITLFSNSSNDDAIGVINPLMIRHVEVYKGAYLSDVGDRVGGLVDIQGKHGEFGILGGKVNLNNQMLGMAFNVPLWKKSVLLLGYRRSYINRSKDTNSLIDKSERLYPDQNYNDFNAKLSGQINKSTLYSLSYFQMKSTNDLKSEFRKDDFHYTISNNIDRSQSGWSSAISHYWKKGGYSKIVVAQSSLNSVFLNNLTLLESDRLRGTYYENDETKNGVNESSIKSENQVILSKHQQLKFGVGIITNEATFAQDTSKQLLKDLNNTSHRANAYIQDKIQLNGRFNVEAGLRVDYILITGNQLFMQPRLKFNYWLNTDLKLHFSTGKYHQFISENSLVDEYGNNLFFWEVMDEKDALSSYHYVIGGIKEMQKTTFKMELFVRNTNGIGRYIEGLDKDKSDEGFKQYNGLAKTYGLDLYAKRSILQHQLWLAYTLSRTTESFDYLGVDVWQRAAHDQTHEVKTAFIFNLKAYHLSFNYVFGSGIPTFEQGLNVGDQQIYSRLDLAFMRDIKFKMIQGQIGASIVNVLNQNNVRYNNFFNYDTEDRIYAAGQPFTPSVFFNVHF